MKPKHLATLILFIAQSNTLAEISTDGTVGPAQSLTATNGNFTISQELGSLKGSNLFHSFQQFNINNGESATFTGANTIQNVISRVTGGNQSLINGILRSQVGNADFFFINPAGVVFGENAQVDVPAAFHMSTAGELEFADGSSFSALNPEASTLTVAAPEGFGFSKGQNGSLALIGGQLTFKPGTNVSLSANQFLMTGIAPNTENFKPAIITVQQTNPEFEPGINLNLTSVDSEKNHSIPINQPAKTATGGSISISNSGINVSGNESGSLFIRGGDIEGLNSTLLSNNTGRQNMDISDSINIHAKSLTLDNTLIGSNAIERGKAGSIQIKSNQSVEMTNLSQISSSTFDSGNTGNISVNTNALMISGPEGINIPTGIFNQVDTGSGGNAAEVAITAETIQLFQGGTINASTFGNGNAGNIHVTTKNLTINGQGLNGLATGIFSDAGNGSTGDAGTIKLFVENETQLFSGAEITSSTFGQGDAKTVEITTGQLTIDRLGFLPFATGILSNAEFGSSGNAGAININASSWTNLASGGVISSTTFGDGNAGNIKLTSQHLTIDGNKFNATPTGIFSNSELITNNSGEIIRANGNAGLIDVSIDESTQLVQGGVISSTTSGKGNAGTVNVTTNQLFIDKREQNAQDTGIFTNALIGSSGNAGTVNINASGSANIVRAGIISSTTFSEGNAGTVNLTAQNLTVDGNGVTESPTAISSSSVSIKNNAGQDIFTATGNAGNVNVNVTDTTQIFSGIISSVSTGMGNAGNIQVNSGQLNIDGNGNNTISGIFSNQVAPDSSGNAGNIAVNVDSLLQLIDGGNISTAVQSFGDGGSIQVNSGQLVIDPKTTQSIPTGISSSTINSFSQGLSGDISITADNSITILNGGVIISSTSSQNSAGNISVKANQLTVDGEPLMIKPDRESPVEPSQISSSTEGSGNAGLISLKINNINIKNGASIDSDTSGVGNAGNLLVDTNTLVIEGYGVDNVSKISSDTSGIGHAGTITIESDNEIQISEAGIISSLTNSQGNAGKVSVQSNLITIDGQGFNLGSTSIRSTAEQSSTGNAGIVEVNAGNLRVLEGGTITSSTFGPGHAGNVAVLTDQLTIDTEGFIDFATAIGSTAERGSSGDAGTVTVNAENIIQLIGSGQVSSASFSSGNAGDIIVDTARLTIDGRQSEDLNAGITSQTTQESTGRVGTISVTASEQIDLIKGFISIVSQNESSSFATETTTNNIPSIITINTPELNLQQNSFIEASANGNINASPITINTSQALNASNSRITTEAFNGNGAPISVNAGSFVALTDSQLTTSVNGTVNGNGGDIRINTPVLILDTGFIQANTTADLASGGDISLNVDQLIASGDRLLRGATQPLEFDINQANFNVIQAASPTGTSGTINITSPELNIVGILAGVETPELNTERIGHDPCSSSQRNSLKSLGHGGLPVFQNGENYLPINSIDDSTSELKSNPEVETIASVNNSKAIKISADCSKTGIDSLNLM